MNLTNFQIYLKKNVYGQNMVLETMKAIKRFTGSMPILHPGARTSLSHSLVVGTPRLPARMRIQLEFS